MHNFKMPQIMQMDIQKERNFIDQLQPGNPDDFNVLKEKYLHHYQLHQEAVSILKKWKGPRADFFEQKVDQIITQHLSSASSLSERYEQLSSILVDVQNFTDTIGTFDSLEHIKKRLGELSGKVAYAKGKTRQIKRQFAVLQISQQGLQEEQVGIIQTIYDFMTTQAENLSNLSRQLSAFISNSKIKPIQIVRCQEQDQSQNGFSDYFQERNQILTNVQEMSNYIKLTNHCMVKNFNVFEQVLNLQQLKRHPVVPTEYSLENFNQLFTEMQTKQKQIQELFQKIKCMNASKKEQSQ